MAAGCRHYERPSGSTRPPGHQQASADARRRGALERGPDLPNRGVAEIERSTPAGTRQREIAVRWRRGFLASAAQGHRAPRPPPSSSAVCSSSAPSEPSSTPPSTRCRSTTPPVATCGEAPAGGDVRENLEGSEVTPASTMPASECSPASGETSTPRGTLEAAGRCAATETRGTRTA